MKRISRGVRRGPIGERDQGELWKGGRDRGWAYLYNEWEGIMRDIRKGGGEQGKGGGGTYRGTKRDLGKRGRGTIV